MPTTTVLKSINSTINPSIFSQNALSHRHTCYSLNSSARHYFETDLDYLIDGGVIASQTVTLATKASHYRVVSLRAFVDILSLPAVPAVVPELRDTDVAIAQKNQSNDALYPYFLGELSLLTQGAEIVIARLRLQNKRPGYYINLSRFLTSRYEGFGADVATAIAFRVTAVDSAHVPQMTDLISIYGEVEEFYPYEMPPSVQETA